jgi:multiple sugar transport system permease protein
MVTSLFYSFTDFTTVNSPSFIGVQNYRDMFDPAKDPIFTKSLAVTAQYVLISVPLNIIVSFLIAFLLSQKIKGRGFFRVAYYLPAVVPVIATSVIWRWVLDPTFGIFNYYLSQVGLPAGRFFFDPATVRPSMAVMGVWSTGATMLLFLGGFQGVPTQLYEAVDVDGGNAVHKFFKVTLPMMSSTLFFNVVIGCINGFQVFTQAYIITRGGPNNESRFVVLRLFETAFTQSRMGYACAIAWVIFLIVLVLTVINFALSRKWVYYEGGGGR